MDAQLVRQDEVARWVVLLRDMIQNGRKLSDAEVQALAVYSAINHVNPTNGECYYLPGVGPVSGIITWRKLGQEQLDSESQVRGKHYFWCQFTAIVPADNPKFDPEKGDIAYQAILRDSWTRARHTQYIVETAVSMKDNLGCDLETALAKAEEYAGEEPVWYGLGVLYGSESFVKPAQPAKDGMPARPEGTDKFDRHERCMKRAEKLAIRKRFSGITLQDADLDYDNGIIDSVVNVPALSVPAPVPPPSSSRPLPPIALRQAINTKAKSYEDTKHQATDQQRKLLQFQLSTIFNSVDIDRHSFINYLFGFTSTKQLSSSQVLALLDWLTLEKAETGLVPSPFALSEARYVLNAALVMQGQLSLPTPEDDNVSV